MFIIIINFVIKIKLGPSTSLQKHNGMKTLESYIRNRCLIN
jgi:hypothetical protein